MDKSSLLIYSDHLLTLLTKPDSTKNDLATLSYVPLPSNMAETLAQISQESFLGANFKTAVLPSKVSWMIDYK